MINLRLLPTSIAFMLTTGISQATTAIITVQRTGNAPRDAEVVVVPFEKIQALLPDARMFHLRLRDSSGNELPLQVTNYEHDHHGAHYDDLVFQYDFKPNEHAAKFSLETISSTAPPLAPRVYARFVPERFDDFAWENDRIAHRVYGPALNSPAAEPAGERMRASGVDVWGKRVTYSVIDRWYLKGHDQFHKDGEGEGLDLYSIGGSRGAGGTGIWDGKTLSTSDNFSAWRVLANGPLRAVFELDYAPWQAGNVSVAERKRFTVEASRNFDEVTSTLTFTGAPQTLAIGITHHPKIETALNQDPKGRFMTIWEQSPDGGLGIAVVLAPDVESAGFAEQPIGPKGEFGNYLLLVKANPSHPVHYFLGAGWEGSGQFKSRSDWEHYVADFVSRVNDPIAVSVSR
jgi:hypothetical protein